MIEMADRRLIRVVAPHFCAGFLTDGTVYQAAPIIKYLIGMSDNKARAYIAKKGWKASVVKQKNPNLLAQLPAYNEEQRRDVKAVISRLVALDLIPAFNRKERGNAVSGNIA